MWYRIRCAFNSLLTAFLVVGLLLFGLGAAIGVVMVIGAVFSVTQHLLGYEPLLTSETIYRPLVFAFMSCGLGAFLGELGLFAIDPKLLKKLLKEQGY